MEKIAEEITNNILNWAKANERWLTPTVVGALGAGVGAMGTGEQGIDETDGEYRARKLRNALILGGLAGGGTAAIYEGIRALGDARPAEYKSDTTKAVEGAGTMALPTAGAVGGGALGIGAGGFTAKAIGELNEAANNKISAAATALKSADEGFINLVKKRMPGHMVAPSAGDIALALSANAPASGSTTSALVRAVNDAAQTEEGLEELGKFINVHNVNMAAPLSNAKNLTDALSNDKKLILGKGHSAVDELRALSKLKPRSTFAGGRIGRFIGKGVGGTVLGVLGLGSGLLANHLLNSSEDNG